MKMLLIELKKVNKTDSKSEFYKYSISKNDRQPKFKFWYRFDNDSLINFIFKNSYIMHNQDNEILCILKILIFNP